VCSQQINDDEDDDSKRDTVFVKLFQSFKATSKIKTFPRHIKICNMLQRQAVQKQVFSYKYVIFLWTIPKCRNETTAQDSVYHCRKLTFSAAADKLLLLCKLLKADGKLFNNT